VRTKQESKQNSFCGLKIYFELFIKVHGIPPAVHFITARPDYATRTVS